jgi:hypothetical protein
VNIERNPDKCVFGVPLGKLLGFLVSHHGIEANPYKIKAIEEMRPPRRLKDMQCLAGCMAALGRFISRLGERALPFFKIMKRSGMFKWTPEAAAVFEDLKQYLTSPPVLVAPCPREPLLLYLAATPQTASAVLVTEREEPIPAKENTASPSPKSHDEGKTSPPLAEAAPQTSLAEEEVPAKLPEKVNLGEMPPQATRGVRPSTYSDAPRATPRLLRQHDVTRCTRTLPHAAEAPLRAPHRL